MIWNSSIPDLKISKINYEFDAKLLSLFFMNGKNKLIGKIETKLYKLWNYVELKLNKIKCHKRHKIKLFQHFHQALMWRISQIKSIPLPSDRCFCCQIRQPISHWIVWPRCASLSKLSGSVKFTASARQ